MYIIPLFIRAKIAKILDNEKGLRSVMPRSPQNNLFQANKESPPLLNIGKFCSHTILNFRHRRDNGYHIHLGACINSFIGHNTRIISHKAHVAFGKILLRRSVAVEHLADGVQPVATAVGVEQHKHSAVSVRHRGKLLELGVATGVHLTLVAHPRATDIARVVITKTSTHRPPPFRCDA